MKGLIIGLGSIAKNHITAIRSLAPKCRLFALRSSQSVTNLIGVSNIYSYEEACKLKVDFIIISNPTSLHEESIEKVLDWNIPLFIEKPVLSDLKNSQTLIDKLTKKGTLTYVACNLRFLHSLQFIKKYLGNKEGYLNEVNVYCGSFLPAWRSNINYLESYSANPELGGGVHLDLIHELDYIYWLFGKPLKVQAIMRSKSSINVKSIDYANYNLIYDTFVSNVTLNYFRRDYKRTVEFVFDNETVLLDLAKNSVTSISGECYFQSNQQIGETYLPQMKYFLDIIDNQSHTSFNHFEDGVEVLKIALNV